jgi:putative FmdB family regulatory protein
MPTYEYECTKCGHAFEIFQSMTDAPRKRCPRCRGKVNRLIGSGAGLLFKGSGFYQTDYRSDGYKKAVAAESKSDSGDGKGKGKTDGGSGAESPAAKGKNAAASSTTSD